MTPSCVKVFLSYNLFEEEFYISLCLKISDKYFDCCLLAIVLYYLIVNFEFKCLLKYFFILKQCLNYLWLNQIIFCFCLNQSGTHSCIRPFFSILGKKVMVRTSKLKTWIIPSEKAICKMDAVRFVSQIPFLLKQMYWSHNVGLKMFPFCL